MNKNEEISPLLTVPKDIIEKHISPFLSLKDLSCLVRSYKNGNFFHKPFQDVTHPTLAQFLKLVAFGEQEKAKELFKKYPKLLLRSGTVEDYSGRIFEDITPFQYALWALDRHMWTMILEYLPEAEAKKQLQDHVYGEKKYKDDHGSHYDFVPLIDALETLLNNFNTWSETQKYHHWFGKISVAQRHVPVHVANEYFREDRSFKPTPKFDEKKLPRSLSYHNYSRGNEMWFPLQDNQGIGIDVGICRSSKDKWGNFVYISNSFMIIVPNDDQISIDLAAITALCKARTNEFVELKKKLLISDQTRKEEVNSTPSPKSSSCTIS